MSEKNNKNYFHIDVMQHTADGIATKFTKTPEGFLEGQAIVTNVGVFTYRDGKGGFIRELRPPEEVFSNDSLKSLQLIPVTNEHPNELVDENNIKKYQKGFSGDSVAKDAYAVSIPIKITDQQTIQDAENGKRALSCGYKADLDFTPGNWMGVPYDAIQRNIRYNHIAVVDKGRAGDLVQMRLDSDTVIDDIYYMVDVSNNDTKNKGGSEMSEPTMRTIHLDDVEYQAEPEVIKTLHKYKADNEELSNEVAKLKKDHSEELSKLTAERDNFKDELEKLKEDKKENVLTDEQIKEAVKERLSLVDAAKKAEIEFNDDMGNTEIKKSVIVKVFPKAVLNDKDDIYINARFDSALELLQEKKEEDVFIKNNEKLKQDAFKVEGIEFSDSESSRSKMIDDLENAWKNEGGK